MARAGNNNIPSKSFNLTAARSEKVEALLTELKAVKQVGKTDYEAPGKPPARLIVKPSQAWRKMVTLG